MKQFITLQGNRSLAKFQTSFFLTHQTKRTIDTMLQERNAATALANASVATASFSASKNCP